MDSRYRILTLCIPWTQSMLSHDVNAATRMSEASWRRDTEPYRPASVHISLHPVSLDVIATVVTCMTS